VPYRRKKLTFAISSPDEFLYLYLRPRPVEHCSRTSCYSSM